MKDGPSAPLLACRDVHAYYGESYVLHGVTLDVPRGDIFALLGRNGAGKTTLLRAIASATPPEVCDRRDPPERVVDQPAAHIGGGRPAISLVPEDRRIIAGLSVEENLRVAQIDGERGWSLERIYQRFPRLAERRRQQAVTLSGGEQQMLAIARALARSVSLLLLDEPYEGLAPYIVREIEALIVELKAAGLTVLLVEQNAVAALEIADRCAILENGALVFSGSPRDVLASEQLRRDYLAL